MKLATWKRSIVREVLGSGLAIGGFLLPSSAMAASQVTYTGSVPLPPAVQPRDAVLATSDGAQIGGVVTVVGNAASSVTAAGAAGVVAGPSDTFPNLWSAAPVLLASDNVVGSIHSASSVTTSSTPVAGTVDQNDPGVTFGPGLSLKVTFPAASTSPVTLTGGSTTLAPARYAKVSTNSAKLTLTAGTYYFASLTMDARSSLVIDDSAGAVTVYVEKNVSIGGPVTSLSGSGASLYLVAFGSSAQVTSSQFEGTLVLPNGTLLVGPSATWDGAIFASYVSVGPSVTINHQPSATFPVPTAPGNGPVPFTPVAVNVCTAPSIGATFHSTGATTGYYDSLTILAPNAAQGICALQYCDANENPIPGPTQAELNAPPPPGSSCPAVPATDNCPVDPNSLTTLCKTDADCPANSVCADHCVDAACTTVEQRCGTYSASCAGLPLDNNCVEYHLCAPPGAIGTPNKQQLASQLAPTSQPDGTGLVDPSQQTTVPPYSTVAAALCTQEPDHPAGIQDGSNKPANDGSQQWGVYLTPTTDFNINPVKNSNGIGELDLKGELGLAFGGIVFGNKFEVLSTDLLGSITDCGVAVGGELKVFGEAIATWTPSAAQNFNLVTNPSDSTQVVSNPATTTSCANTRDLMKQERQDLRKSNLFARAVNEYYLGNGFTPQLCTDIVEQLPQYASDPGNGQPVDCSNLSSMPVPTQLNILNAWKKEYDGHTTNWLNFSQSLQTSRMQLQTSGTITLFKSPHVYNLTLFNVPIPIGPITLTLAADGFGSWDLEGGVQFGFGIDGPSQSTSLLQSALNSISSDESLNLGDIRAFAGPVVTPAASVGVLAFAGVGIPGVSVGIQGKIDLLDISLPTGVVGAAMRLSSADTRDLSSTDYAGAPIAGMSPTDYRWVTGYQWGSNLDLSELSGELDLAVRVSLLFFNHTWSMKLFSWPGIQQQPFALVGTGGPINYASDYGKDGDNVAYTQITPITDNPPNLGNGGTPPSCGVIQ